MKEAFKAKLRESATYKFVGKGIYGLRNKLFDLKYNVETARDVELKDLKIDSPNVGAGVMYSGTDPKSFKALFDAWKIPSANFTFIDLGSGKGRVLLMASEYPFKKIIGVEFSGELNQTAQKNIRSYRNPAQKCRDIEAVCEDATKFALPAAPLVFYIFNPFLEEIVAQVLANIEKSFRENPREIYFIYSYPAHKHLFDKSPVFKENYSNEWYSIYKTI